MDFLKGETDPVGDCGNFAAGIDVHGADQFPHDSKKRTWYSRVECYGYSAEQAEELRDKVLALLVSTNQPQPIYDEANESNRFHDWAYGVEGYSKEGTHYNWERFDIPYEKLEEIWQEFAKARAKSMGDPQ